MAAISNRNPHSSLNPNAPMFVPWVYRTVEDFSEEWWELVQSSPCFRDYWLRECYQEPQDGSTDFYPNADDLELQEMEAAFDGYKHEQEDEEEEKGSKDVVSLAALKWRKHRAMPERAKYAEKAGKIVSVKVSPKMIQQPR